MIPRHLRGCEAPSPRRARVLGASAPPLPREASAKSEAAGGSEGCARGRTVCACADARHSFRRWWRGRSRRGAGPSALQGAPSGRDLGALPAPPSRAAAALASVVLQLPSAAMPNQSTTRSLVDRRPGTRTHCSGPAALPAGRLRRRQPRRTRQRRPRDCGGAPLSRRLWGSPAVRSADREGVSPDARRGEARTGNCRVTSQTAESPSLCYLHARRMERRRTRDAARRDAAWRFDGATPQRAPREAHHCCR